MKEQRTFRLKASSQILIGFAVVSVLLLLTVLSQAAWG